MYAFDIDLDELTAWLEVVEKAPDLAEQEALIAMRKAVEAVKRETVPRTPKNTGALASAWSTKVSRGMKAVKGEIANPLVYAIVMEKGRQPGSRMPPEDPIVYWLRRKAGLSLEAAIEASYPVRRAIARRGIKGKKMLEEGLEAAKPTVRRIFDDVPGNVWKKLS